MTAVQLAAEHGARIRVLNALLRQMIAAITNAEVQPTIRPNDQAMHVVSTIGKVNSIAFVKRFARVADAIPIAVGQFKQRRNIGVVNLAAVGQHARTATAGDPIEMFGEYLGLIHFPVGVGVLDNANSIVEARVRFSRVRMILQNVVHAVLNRLCRKLFVQPVSMSPIVLDALVLSKGLANKHASLVVAVKRDDIGDVGFGSKQLATQARVFNVGDRVLPVAAGLGDRRFIRLSQRRRRLFFFFGACRRVGRIVGCRAKSGTDQRNQYGDQRQAIRLDERCFFGSHECRGPHSLFLFWMALI